MSSSPYTWMPNSSYSPVLFMPTFRTHEGDHGDCIAVWRRLLRAFVRVFPAIGNADGLLIYLGSANLTLLHQIACPGLPKH
jgi:hypothetical protein